jgi:hypothetical protein
MDLTLLSGQRPADVLKIRRTDIHNGALWIVQNKTGARIGIEITGELAAVIARVRGRPCRAISPYLIQDENGHSEVLMPMYSASVAVPTFTRKRFRARSWTATRTSP